jgi:hypothetical protein
MENVLDQRDIQKPEWIRLPRPGDRDRLTGLSRSSLCDLAVPGKNNDFRPPVKSVLLRKRNATRGIRLINFDSLIAHLRELETESATR